MQTSGLNRDTIDKFYTKSTVSKECCDIIKQFININSETDIIIEPSAGNGSFIPELFKMSSNCLFYDIQPEHSDIIKKDYLTFDIQNLELPDLYSKIHIIGNPPFGRQSSLAIKFIKKSTEFCDTISFILPKSFKKDSMQKHFPLMFHLVYQYDLNDKSFIINNDEEKDVPCVFQIWEKRSFDRDQIIKQISTRFKFVKIDELPDISFRRVGVNAGKIDTNNLIDKSIQSHYFIKFDDDLDKQKIIYKISKIVYENNNTVGPKSISKQEIIKEFNKLFTDDL
jgi:predicted RNA methylase